MREDVSYRLNFSLAQFKNNGVSCEKLHFSNATKIRINKLTIVFKAVFLATVLQQMPYAKIRIQRENISMVPKQKEMQRK